MDGGRAGEAVGLLHAVLERTRGLTGNGVATNRGRTLGSLGAASFRAGDKTRAIEFTQQALEMCRQVGDEEGVRIYSRNIQHIQDEGRTQTEAPVIVFRSADGRTLTLEELQGVTGTFRYEIVGGADVPAEAKALHQRAREAGGATEDDHRSLRLRPALDLNVLNI